MFGSDWQCWSWGSACDASWECACGKALLESPEAEERLSPRLDKFKTHICGLEYGAVVISFLQARCAMCGRLNLEFALMSVDETLMLMVWGCPFLWVSSGVSVFFMRQIRALAPVLEFVLHRGVLHFIRKVIGLKAGFYNNYTIQGNLFEAVISALLENGAGYNLLCESAV